MYEYMILQTLLDKLFSKLKFIIINTGLESCSRLYEIKFWQ